jgi:hypothetical protein
VAPTLSKENFMEEEKVEQPSQEVPEWKKQEGEPLTKPNIAELKTKAARDRMAKARAARVKKPIPEVPISPAIKIEKVLDEPIMFFTESDIDPVTKKIKNTYPTYFNRKQKEDLEEEIRKMEKGLENKYYQADDIGKVRETLSRAKKSLETLQEHAPSMEKNKDRIYNMTKELSEKIAPAMFSRSDMMKGTADAHEEARRMSEPTIELSPELVGTALANGMKVHGRMVTRDDAVRLWQFGRRTLGELSDAEVLRRD